MPEDHEEAIRSSFEAWNEGDFERWLQQAHPDCEYGPGILIGRTEGEQVVYRGRDELREFFDEWQTTWRTKLTIHSIEVYGNRALVLGRMRMTGNHSGATVEQDAAFISEVEDDRLRRLWSYPSHEAAREAIEAPARA